MYEQKARLLTRSPVGLVNSEGVDVYDYGTSRWSSSKRDRRLAPYLGELSEGGVVIDKLATGAKGVNFIINGPMVDLTLAGDAYEEAPMPSEWLMAGLQGSYKSMATARVETSWQGLSSVGITKYMQLWRGLGASVGIRSGDRIIWENKEDTLIPTFEARYEEHPIDGELE